MLTKGQVIRGGCFCGSVKYKLTSPPQEAYYCHCRDCQYMSGSFYHVFGVVDRGSIELVSGELSEFDYQSQDGSGMKREFCKRCGTPLFASSTRFRNIQMFTLSSLDDPNLIRPSFEVWTKSKLPWAHIGTDIKSYPHGSYDVPSP